MSEREQSIQDFACLLNEIDDGKLRDEASKSLSELLLYLHAQALDKSTMVKGKLSLSLTVSVDKKGMVAILGDITVKQPAPLRGIDNFYLSRNGKGLSRSNPKQQSLPLREVGKAVETPREPGVKAQGDDE